MKCARKSANERKIGPRLDVQNKSANVPNVKNVNNAVERTIDEIARLRKRGGLKKTST